ncbi:MAG: PAS domain-containing protein [Deltaproteobacteria bacterium]|nr:PAS domain-containing protein [Deltaproteobacteria bacterium]
MNSSFTPPQMHIGFIGGGRRCLAIMEMLGSDPLRRFPAEIAGVADTDPEAVGFREARRRGIFTTGDFRELLALESLDLVIELTGDPRILQEVIRHKPETVGLMDYGASLIFHDMLSFGQELDKKDDELSLIGSLAQALTTGTSHGVMVLDPDYRIRKINEQACRQAGVTADQAKGRFCFQITHQALTPCDSPDTPCPLVESVYTGKPAHALHEHLNTVGGSHFCDVYTYPLVNRKGDVVQVVEIFRDITSELATRLESRTQAIKDDLARLVQEDKLISLGKLVASVAHEINNPIGSILNFTKLIHKNISDHAPSREELQDYRKWLDLTVQEARRCARIVSNLLSFSRQQTLEPKRLDLRELLDQVLLLTAHRLELANIRLETDALGADPLEVWGDHTQIQQCFLNLVFNALEAMPQGGVLTISGGKDPVKNEVWIGVTDTGEGIQPENRPHIFEPFFSTKQASHGVGLGLSMVYGIVTEHHGRIEVESQPGSGATFKITWPGISREASTIKEALS